MNTTPSPAPNGPVADILVNPGEILHRIEHAIAHDGPVVGTVLAAAALFGVVGFLAARARIRARRHAAYSENAQIITVLAPPRVDIHGAEALWSHLLGLLRPPRARLLAGQPHIAFEYAFTRAGATIRLWVPGTVPPQMIERAIGSAWPGAHTTTAPATVETAPLPVSATATGGRLVLARNEILPIQTKHDVDPLRPLLGACASLGGSEYAAVQILARPVTGRRARAARRKVRVLRGGGAETRPQRLLDALVPGTRRTSAKNQSGGTGGMDPAQAAQYRAASAKSAGGLWEVRIGYAAASSEPGERESSPRLRGRAHQIASAFSVYSGANFLARKRLSNPAPVLASRAFHGPGHLLSATELAALAHLPLDAGAAGIERAGAASVAPPPGILAPDPRGGIKPIGITDTGIARPVGLAVSDARHHLHVMGATGSGKSTLMTHMVLDDVAAGRGAIVVDPKGDMIIDILSRLPESIASRTVLFDADDAACPPRLNVLQCDQADDRDMVVDNVTGIFSRIFRAYWGPRTDDVFRAACLTLLTNDPSGNSHLGDVADLLTNPVVRARKTAGIADPVLKGFWESYEQLTDANRASIIGPLMNKLRAFLLRSFVRNSIASGPSSFDMGQVLDGGLLLARIPKGILGEQTTQLIGSLIVAKAWQGASKRARIPQSQRIDCSLYLDEGQNFLNLPYPVEDIIAEARGYRLSLTFAHQNLAQLPKDLREGISANARTKVFFNASPEDARELERHTSPLLHAHDLSHLGVYQAAARLVAAGEEKPAFTLRTTPLPPAIPGRDTLIRDAARAAFGRAPTVPGGSGAPETESQTAEADPRFWLEAD